MTEERAIAACRKGLLLPIEGRDSVEPDPTEATSDDFLDTAFLDCPAARNV